MWRSDGGRKHEFLICSVPVLVLPTDAMTDFGVTFTSLLGKKDKVYFINKSQRGYRWSEERVVSLLDSIWELSLKPEEEQSFYFMGAIITTPNKCQERRYGLTEISDVVDGQQRLFTFSLLVAATLYTAERLGHDTDVVKDRLPLTLLRNAGRGGRSIGDWRLENVHRSRFEAWKEVVCGDTMPIPASLSETAMQYGKNYKALFERLNELLQPVDSHEAKAGQLASFAQFLDGRVRVLYVSAPDAVSARNAFRVSNTPGEPLDTATLMRMELKETLKGTEDEEEDVNKLEEQFNRGAPGADFEEDDRSMFATARAFMRDVALDPENGPEELISVVKPFRAAAAHFFMRVLPLHSDMLKVFSMRGSITHDKPAYPQFSLRSALRALFALEEAGRRTSRDLNDSAVREESVLWRPVAMRLLDVLNVRDLTSLKGRKLAGHDVATEALKHLERLLLFLMLVKAQGQLAALRKRLNDVLNQLGAFNPQDNNPLEHLQVSNLASALLLQPPETKKLLDTLNCELYKPNASLRTTALRHTLVRLNELFYASHMRDKVVHPMGDLVFNQDWTTEHIFPQTARKDDDGQELDGDFRRFFDCAQGEKPLHMLGNLGPLDTFLQPVARNNPFNEKQVEYRKANNHLMRNVGEVTVYVPGPSFLPAQFVMRHNTLKRLLAENLFGIAADKVQDVTVAYFAAPGAVFHAPAAGGADASTLIETLASQEVFDNFDVLLKQRDRPMVTRLPPQKKRDTYQAFDEALETIDDSEKRDAVRKRIVMLHALAQKGGFGCHLYFLLANGCPQTLSQSSKYLRNSRRVMMAHLFRLGFLKLEDFEKLPLQAAATAAVTAEDAAGAAAPSAGVEAEVPERDADDGAPAERKRKRKYAAHVGDVPEGSFLYRGQPVLFEEFEMQLDANAGVVMQALKALKLETTASCSTDVKKIYIKARGEAAWADLINSTRKKPRGGVAVGGGEPAGGGLGGEGSIHLIHPRSSVPHRSADENDIIIDELAPGEDPAVLARPAGLGDKKQALAEDMALVATGY